VFSPSRDFRFSLHLIAGNIDSLCRELRGDPDRAKEIVEGKVLLASEEVDRLVKVAREVSGA
jgi:hypothetical protein